MHFTRVLLSVVFLLSASAALAAPPEKVLICHFSADDGVYNLISVPTNSAHFTKQSDDFVYPGADVTAVYRLYNDIIQDHLYTTSLDEVGFAVTIGYKFEGVMGYAYTVDGVDFSPVYRLYSDLVQDHLYTMNADELESAESVGYEQEGIGWYAFDAAVGATAPVYRLYNDFVQDHLYTMNADERDALVSDGWINEGVLGYMFARAVTCD